MRVSVVVITKNEADVIERCLRSVDWADEVIVLDSGSADRTVEISQRLGARVSVTADWPGFGPQKNRALEKATGDWVFSLDADEWVTPDLRDEILNAVSRPDGAVAFRVPRLSSFCGRYMRHSGWWPDYVTRLFRRGAAKFSDDVVHEHVIVDIRRSGRAAAEDEQLFFAGGAGYAPRWQEDRAHWSRIAGAVGIHTHLFFSWRISRRPRGIHARSGHRRGDVLPLRKTDATGQEVMQEYEL